MAGQNNYNKMAYNGAQPGPIMNQPLSANQIQHQVNAQRHRKPNLLSIENNPRNRFKKFKKQNVLNRLNIDKMSVQCTVISSRLDTRLSILSKTLKVLPLHYLPILPNSDTNRIIPINNGIIEVKVSGRA